MTGRKITDRIPIDNGDGTHTVPLTRGMSCIIDSADAEMVGKHAWHASKCGKKWYARRKVGPSIGGKSVSIHTAIMSPPDGMEVDHVNGDGLDNRRSNLRVADSSQNKCNRAGGSHSASGMKGAHWMGNGKWAARICFRGKHRHIGTFATAEEAHAAYCEEARRLHGEYARTA